MEEVVKVIRNPDVIQVTQHCLQYIHTLAAMRHGSPRRRDVPEFINVKVFLAGYLVVYQTSRAFERMRSLETALLNAAAPLVARVRVICEEVRLRGTFEAVPWELTKDFNAMLYAYVSAFKQWKAPDEIKVCTRLQHQLNALYDTLEMLGDRDPLVSDKMLRQIEAMRANMQDVAGIDAVHQFDLQRQTLKKEKVEGASWPEQSRMTREQLQHEMLLDPNFQLPVSSAKDPISQTLADAFWGSLVSDLTLPNNPCFSRVIKVLGEIKKDLPALDEALDLDFIEDQADAGLFTWDRCMQLIRTIHSFMEPLPADAELWKVLEECPQAPQEQAQKFCRCLRLLLAHGHTSSLKDCNFRLRRIAVNIQEQGVQMEQRTFQAKLDQGTVTLERVEQWLHRQPAESLSSIVLSGLLELLFEAPTQWPETLALDVVHLEALRADIHSIGTATTMMVVARDILNGESNKEEAGRALTCVCAMLADEVPLHSIMDASGLSDPLLCARLKDSLAVCATPTHAVRRVM
jgi:hypothetical protein